MATRYSSIITQACYIAKMVWKVDIQEHFFDTRTWLAAIGGAIVILVAYRLIRRVAS